MLHIQPFCLGELETNCYILHKDNKTIVIDPSAEANKIIAYLEKNKLSVEKILLTHAHFDHVGALAELKSLYPLAKIYLHEKDLELYNNISTQRIMFNLGVTDKKVPKIDCFLKENDLIKWGEIQFECLFTPGHSPGSVSYYNAEIKSLFSGDVIFDSGGVGRADLPGGNFEQLKKSVLSLLKLPEEIIAYPGHGPSFHIKEAKKHFF